MKTATRAILLAVLALLAFTACASAGTPARPLASAWPVLDNQSWGRVALYICRIGACRRWVVAELG